VKHTMQMIANTLSQITLGLPVSADNLTMWPMLNASDDEPDYLMLDDALGKGLATVTETCEGGSVPELRFVNNCDSAVLLVDGEELVGAKQNRVLNLTILAPPRRELQIPVSCVERGRWQYDSMAFSSTSRAQFAESRANRIASVSYCLRATGSRDSDQGKVWHDIDELAEGLSVESPTSAMSDIFDSYETKLDEHVGLFEPTPNQVGALFAIDGKVIGFDLFAHASTLRRFLPKAVRSFGLQAQARQTTASHEIATTTAAQSFLECLAEGQMEGFPAIGEGEDVRIEGATVSAAALVARGRVIHMCGFQLNQDAMV
jgi:hypothetical protein